jgi:hypothetical protein
VNPALLTVTADNTSRLYGDPNPGFTAKATGFQNSDTVSVLTGLAFSTPATVPSPVGGYAITPGGATNANYAITYVPGTLTVNKAPLTLTVANASRLYGDPDPAFHLAGATGLRNADTLAVIEQLAFTATFSSAPVGPHAIRASGTAANYDLTFMPGTLTITPAPLTAIVANASRLYGQPDPTFMLASVAGLKNGEAASVIRNLSFTGATFNTAPVGTYTIGATGTADNYAITFVPGTLTVNRAPLTISATSHRVAYGDALPVFNYTLNGLMPWDSASVIGGVALAPPTITGATPPGAYPISITTGTAQNYAITLVPGTLDITRRPYVVTADSITTVTGAIPRVLGVTAPPVMPGGPQFSFTAQATANNNSPPGTYRIVPVPSAAPGTTLSDIQRFYDYQPRPGTLTLNKPPIDPIVMNQVMNGDVQIVVTTDLPSNVTIDPKKIDFTPAPPVVASPTMVTPSIIADVVSSYGAGLKDRVAKMLDNNATELGSLKDEHWAILQAFREGKISLSDLVEGVRSDGAIRAAIMPVLAVMMMDTLQSGRPLTSAEQRLVERVSLNVNTARQIYADELTRQRNEYFVQKSADTAANQYAIKTMPDIAVTAQQAALERAIGLAAGAGGGVALGTGAIVGVNTLVSNVGARGGQAGSILGTKVTERIAQEGVKTSVRLAPRTAIGVSGAAAIIGVAVSLVIIGVEAGIMVAEDLRNQEAYNNAMARANTKVDRSLSNLDLNHAQTRVDFLTGFGMTMIETSFTPGK